MSARRLRLTASDNFATAISVTQKLIPSVLPSASYTYTYCFALESHRQNFVLFPLDGAAVQPKGEYFPRLTPRLERAPHNIRRNRVREFYDQSG